MYFQYGKFEAPEAVKPINGYLGTEYAHKPRAITGYSLLEHRHEDERYHQKSNFLVGFRTLLTSYPLTTSQTR